MVELYKDDLIHVLYSIKISCDKKTMRLTIDLILSNYRHSHNLGGHDILLETVYDFLARNKF